jgi:hypothetical protein
MENPLLVVIFCFARRLVEKPQAVPAENRQIPPIPRISLRLCNKTVAL